ncbi:MAG: sodium:solute symporter [candidate division KSB1 bacterium]|nr:sodium:solute symporter [candidate division KSB1 bacterium]
MTEISLVIIILFLYLGITLLAGIALGRRPSSGREFFNTEMPWWAVCLSIVATETSTLTVISVPGLAYTGDCSFLQLAAGYIIGRTVAAVWLLTQYFKGQVSTAYELLLQRSGKEMRTTASLLFIITRLLADGVRLFAAAIPLSLLTGWSISLCIIASAAVTTAYAAFGGIRSVVRMDVVQTAVYLFGAVVCVYYLMTVLPNGPVQVLEEAALGGKFRVIDLGTAKPLSLFFQRPYTLAAGLLGGMFLSLASHGTDHLIVQRLLTCRTLRRAQAALICSGFFVFFQFALFLLLGVLLYQFYGGAAQMGDQVFPRFIIEELPAIPAGLAVAALFAAAMSTLSSSLNSLASSTWWDLTADLKIIPPQHEVGFLRLLSLFWGLLLTGAALLFRKSVSPVVELGLTIASFTYGGVLGVFLLSLCRRRPSEQLLFSLWSSLVLMIPFIAASQSVKAAIGAGAVLFGFLVGRSASWYGRILLLIVAVISWGINGKTPNLAWTWYVPTGTALAVTAAYVYAGGLKIQVKIRALRQHRRESESGRRGLRE